MAPEHLRSGGRSCYGMSADIFSLAITLYELFSGLQAFLKLPFKVFLRPAFFINGLFKLGATIFNAMTFSKMAITIMANLQQLAY